MARFRPERRIGSQKRPMADQDPKASQCTAASKTTATVARDHPAIAREHVERMYEATSSGVDFFSGGKMGGYAVLFDDPSGSILKCYAKFLLWIAPRKSLALNT